MRKSFINMAAVCITSAALLFTGCAGSDTKNEELTEVRLNEVVHSVFYAPQYVALENGYFEEEGLKIDLSVGQGADKSMTALISGSADIALLGTEAGIYVYNQNRYTRADVKVPVLLYHNFVTTVLEVDSDNFNYINTPQSFEENIKTFLENGYTIISMKELALADNGKIELPSKPIVITFDDGYYSNYEYIYPILKKYNVKASIFIITDKVGKKIDGIKYLGWEECLEMQNSGLVEIFSHSNMI